MRNVARNVAVDLTMQKARHRKSMPSFALLESGRRDLNPRPPEPHSNELGFLSIPGLP
jgi:hypothetical protein